jgi:hypothetical protein
MPNNHNAPLRSLVLVAALALGTLAALSGCHMYLDDGDWDQPSPQPSPQPQGQPIPESDAGGLGFTCESNVDCAAGCYCADTWCQESGFCETSDDCSEGYVCDERDTCIPESDEETCQGEVTCEEEAPNCGSGSTPTIQNGCYNGTCIIRSLCPDGAPFTCSDLNDSEDSCIASLVCSPVYTGINCTSGTGAACTTGSQNCTCAAFVFNTCEEAESP